MSGGKYKNPDERPPEKPCVACGCCPMRLHWHRTGKNWKYDSTCVKCYTARHLHDMSSHIEYNNYLAKGCWVCGQVAVAVDHDHRICKSGKHSCKSCRRGPICHGCNSALREGSTVESLRKRGNDLLAYGHRQLLAADALERYQAVAA